MVQKKAPRSRGLVLEAPIGIEPMSTGFAVPGLTTWLRRLAFCPYNSGRLRGPGVVERVMGFEPTTSTLARLHSTTELHPRRTLILPKRRGRSTTFFDGAGGTEAEERELVARDAKT